MNSKPLYQIIFERILKAGFILCILVLTFSVPYLIHVRWSFFGASLVTVEHIIALWIIFPVITFSIGWALYEGIFG